MLNRVRGAALFISLVFAASVPFETKAQTTYVASGSISQIFVSYLNNYAFRVIMSSALPQACTDNFLYVDGSASNYQAYISSLMMAYSTGKHVAIEYNVVSGGYCSISEFMVGP
jgi:hypothetical protein